MIRDTVIAAVRAYLSDAYDGPIALHPEVSTEAIDPPYAVIRVGSDEEMFPGDTEIWDMNILIGVFHDADVTTAPDAESQARELFDLLADPDGLFTDSVETLVWSALERIGTEASIVETRWQHIAAWRGIVAPVAED